MPGFDKASYVNSEDKISVYRALAIMGIAHNVAIAIKEGQVKMLGDPMEVKMIKFTGFYSVEPKNPQILSTMHNPVRGVNYNIIRKFEFFSELGRMSVIATIDERKGTRLYTKGAPEVLKTLCDQKSLPKNYDERLSDYTLLGYRVLALAWRDLTPSEERKNLENLDREHLEKDLMFVGFVIFENMLKMESRDTVTKLSKAQLDTKIVTGDNAVTSIHVARETTILPPEGVVFVGDIIEHESHYYLHFRKIQGRDSTLLAKFKRDNASSDKLKVANKKFGADSHVLKVTHYMDKTMFGRMSSANAGARASEYLMTGVPKGGNVDYAFTGKAFEFLRNHSNLHQQSISDWRLRMILLRAKVYSRMQPNHKTLLMEMLQAHGRLVGMVGDGANDCGALQSADIGISLSQFEASISAPLTSKLGLLTTVEDVLREGRCLLAANIQVFKYMALYSIIQYSTVTLLNGELAVLSNAQLLWQDLAIVVPIFVAMGWTAPYHELEDDLPSESLFTPSCLLSLLGLGAIQLGGQLAMLSWLRTYSFYVPANQLYEEAIITDGSSSRISTSMEGSVLFVFSLSIYIAGLISYNISKPFRQPLTSNIFLIVIIVFHLLILGLVAFVKSVRVDLFGLHDGVSHNFIKVTIGISMGFGFVMYLYETFFINGLIKSCERVQKTKTIEHEQEKLFGMAPNERMEIVY